MKAALARFGWGLLLGSATKLLGVWLHQFPSFSLLATTSVSFLAWTCLFGPAGLLGVVVAHAGFVAARHESWIYLGASTGVYALASLLALAVFVRIPGTGRSMPNLKSFAWLAAAGAVGGILSALVVALWSSAESPLAEAAIWMRSTVVSVWLFVPPLLVAGERYLTRWVYPLPDEEKRRGVELEGRERWDRLGALLTGIALVGGVLAVEVTLSRGFPELGVWLDLLYFLPLYWATRRYRLAGGLLAAAAVGLAYLAGKGVDLPPGPLANRDPESVGIYAQLLFFLGVGVLLGQAWQQETDLRWRLEKTNELLRQDLRRVVRALTGAVEAKDIYTEGHLRRVNDYALEVGARLGLSRDDLDLLEIAGVLHDIGKIGIPESILNKPGPLDGEERQVMQRHPEIGARLLADLEGLSPAAPLVLHHQERWDGRREGPFPGYPHGLSGEQIPLGARIIAVVDAFDAMTTDRPYRGALPIAEAIGVLRSERGAQFDPRVVDTFLALLEEKPWS